MVSCNTRLVVQLLTPRLKRLLSSGPDITREMTMLKTPVMTQNSAKNANPNGLFRPLPAGLSRRSVEFLYPPGAGIAVGLPDPDEFFNPNSLALNI